MIKLDTTVTLAVGEVKEFTLTNSNGMSAVLTNYGAILVSLFVPDKNGDEPPHQGAEGQIFAEDGRAGARALRLRAARPRRDQELQAG